MSVINKLKKELEIQDFMNSFAFIIFSLVYLYFSISNPSIFYERVSHFDGLLSFSVFTGMIFLLMMVLYNDRIFNIIIKYYSDKLWRYIKK